MRLLSLLLHASFTLVTLAAAPPPGTALAQPVITVKDLKLVPYPGAEQDKLRLTFTAAVNIPASPSSAATGKKAIVKTERFSKQFQRLFLHRVLRPGERKDLREFRHGVRVGSRGEEGQVEFVLWEGGELRVAVWGGVADDGGKDLFFADGKIDAATAVSTGKVVNVKMESFRLAGAKEVPWEKSTFHY